MDEKEQRNYKRGLIVEWLVLFASILSILGLLAVVLELFF